MYENAMLFNWSSESREKLLSYVMPRYGVSPIGIGSGALQKTN